MARNVKVLLGLIVLTMVITGLNSPSKAAPFYKGKTITMYTPAPAGGGLSRVASVFIKYMPKYIEGNPTIIIKNMPGGGGLKSLNYLADKGKPDGLSLHWGGPRYLALLMGFPGQRYNIDDFDYVGVGSTSFASLIRTDTPPGIKTAADVMKTNRFKIGGQGPTSGLDLFSRLPLDILGLQYIYIPGYKGQPQMNAAIRSKEINFLTTGVMGFHIFYANTILKDGTAQTLFYHPVFNAQGQLIPSENYPAGIDNFVTYYEKNIGKKLSGPQFEAYKWICTYATQALMILTPKGIPQEAMEQLRKAHAATAKDPEYKAAHIKQFSSWPIWSTGETIDEMNKSYKDVSPEAMAVLKALTTPTKKKK